MFDVNLLSPESTNGRKELKYPSSTLISRKNQRPAENRVRMERVVGRVILDWIVNDDTSAGETSRPTIRIMTMVATTAGAQLPRRASRASFLSSCGDFIRQSI